MDYAQLAALDAEGKKTEVVALMPDMSEEEKLAYLNNDGERDNER